MKTSIRLDLGRSSRMAFDFKKEQREFYLPKRKPEIIKVPKMSYIAVRGKGDPNDIQTKTALLRAPMPTKSSAFLLIMQLRVI